MEKSQEEQRREIYEKAETRAGVHDAKILWKSKHPNETLKEHKKKYIHGLIDKLPWEDYIQKANNAQNNIDNPSR